MLLSKNNKQIIHRLVWTREGIRRWQGDYRNACGSKGEGVYSSSRKKITCKKCLDILASKKPLIRMAKK